MKKIPSLFKRDFENNPRLVTTEYNEDVEWVLNGEGYAFRKWDGTAVMVKGGRLYKRYDAKKGKPAPANGIACQEPDPETGHWPHWVPVDYDSKADRWLIEAHMNVAPVMDGTYEAIGPKINGNKDRWHRHELFFHRYIVWRDVPTTYEELKGWFKDNVIEGIVWHHQSGDDRMVKIKRSDFGLPW